MTPLADSHCHLSHIERDAADVVDEAARAGVEIVIDVGMGLEGSRDAAGRAATLDGVYASVGLHPNDLAEFEADPDGAMQELRQLAATERVVAVGETGLDHYRERSSHEVQEGSFRAHIALAKEVDRTLVIHCRDAHADVLRVLDDAGPPSRVVMHCFSGDVTHARECVDRGFYCSFAGNITYKRTEALRDAARIVPNDLLLVETDAPFLAPVPLRGKPNAPALVVHTTEALAAVRSTTPASLAEMLWNNTSRAFVIA